MAKEIPNAEKDTVVSSNVEKGVQKIEITMKDKSPDKSFVVVKDYGQKIEGTPEEEKKVYVFVSTRKEMSIFYAFNKYIKFQHHYFKTDDLDIVNIIKKNGLFGSEIFADEFPPHVKAQLEEARKYITRDSEMFT